MIDCWCKHGIKPPCQLTQGFQVKVLMFDENVYYSMSLAGYNFWDMP